MMSNEKYLKLKRKSNENTPSSLIELLEFNEALLMVCDLLNNEEWNESLQEYAVNILEELRKKHPEQWDVNWKHDALLGYAYHITLNYEKRYAAYIRAFNKITPAPPQLLVAIARCCIAPGKPPITEEEAISLVQQAITPVNYVEAIELLRGLYKSTGNIKEEKYWEKILDSIKDTGPHLPPLYQIFDS